jgi:hypothetical protein
MRGRGVALQLDVDQGLHPLAQLTIRKPGIAPQQFDDFSVDLIHGRVFLGK